ncbi:MAG: hypothetical protein APF80_13405 [Alphaproteobacteria bacterium BRH_c36]|nr:MAG: hypothetical protein APF80_13405 [Alphaproteobacteria bacterium BRH_c36]
MERTMKPKIDFTKIKNALPIDIALAHYGITLKVSGPRLVGCCPIHDGTNKRAFVVSTDHRAWHCFGDCKRGGTVLDLVRALEKCSLVEAAKIIAKRYGLGASR